MMNRRKISAKPQEKNGEADINQSSKTSLMVQIPSLNELSQSERSPFIVPMQYEPFARSFYSKYSEGFFLGRVSNTTKADQRRQYGQIRRVARANLLNGVEALEPSEQALDRTKQAAQAFFSLSYQLLSQHDSLFPLAGRNKCLGMVAVPNTKLVILAISQDKDPSSDERLRHDMIVFLHQLNRASSDWRFELASLPTKAQYLMPRTFEMRAPQAAPEASVKPHTRCVEVALMAALCKAGRTKSFTASETGIIAFGGTLWASPTGGEAILHFQGVNRNRKYTEKPAVEVTLSPSMKGWIDIWEPCPEHCRIYKYEMLAIGAAGGFSGSFFEPRSEGLLLKQRNKLKKTRLTTEGVLAGISFGLISASVANLCNAAQDLTLSKASNLSMGLVAVGASLTLLFAINSHKDLAQTRAMSLLADQEKMDAKRISLNTAMTSSEEDNIMRCRACTF